MLVEPSLYDAVGHHHIAHNNLKERATGPYNAADLRVHANCLVKSRLRGVQLPPPPSPTDTRCLTIPPGFLLTKLGCSGFLRLELEF